MNALTTILDWIVKAGVPAVVVALWLFFLYKRAQWKKDRDKADVQTLFDGRK